MNQIDCNQSARLVVPGIVTLLILSLTGCGGTPEIVQPTLPSSRSALNARGEIISQHPEMRETSSPSAWWSLFNDETLSKLEHMAASDNLDLVAAITRVDESRAQLGLVESARRPQVAGSAGYANSAISQNSPLALLDAPTAPSSTWTLGLQADWELDLWGHLRQLTNSANAQLDASIYGVAQVKVSVAGDVARTYLLLRGTQQQIVIVNENIKIANDLVNLAKSRHQNGVATRYDEAAAMADVASIEARLAQLQQQRDALSNALAFLLNKAPHELDSTIGDADIPSMPGQLPIGIPSELARNRPDILQAEARLRAAVADIGAAKADFYPRINLTGNIGVQAFQFSDLGYQGSRTFSVGPSLYLPIFQGGRLKSNLALTEAKQRLAGIAWQQTVLRAWHEVDDALNAYTTELKRHEQLQLAVAQNKTALDVANRGYQQGSSDFTSVLVARRTLLSSEAELTECTTASALSVVSLYRALGGGWSESLHPNKSIKGGA